MKTTKLVIFSLVVFLFLTSGIKAEGVRDKAYVNGSAPKYIVECSVKWLGSYNYVRLNSLNTELVKTFTDAMDHSYGFKFSNMLGEKEYFPWAEITAKYFADSGRLQVYVDVPTRIDYGADNKPIRVTEIIGSIVDGSAEFGVNDSVNSFVESRAIDPETSKFDIKRDVVNEVRCYLLDK